MLPPAWMLKPNPGLGPAWLWAYALGTSLNVAKGLFGPQSPVMYPRISKPGAYPTFQRIGTTSPITPYMVQNFMVASEWSRDNPDGDATTGADWNLLGPTDISSALLMKWGAGVVPSDVRVAGSQFGSTLEVWGALYNWASPTDAMIDWALDFFVGEQTSIKNTIGAMAAQAPFFFARLPEGGIYAGVYPENTTDGAHNYYKDSDGNRVKIHPNSHHPSAADFGKPYGVTGFHAALTSEEEVFNRFSVNYRQDATSGRLMEYQRVTEADGTCRLWNAALEIEEPPSGDATDLAADITDNLATVCAASQARYGVREMPEVNMDLTFKHFVATAFLHYLVKRYTNQRVVFGCHGGIEFSDLRPGHIIQVSNDMNFEFPRPDYINDPAKLAGWNTTGATGVADYLVNRVRLLPASGAFVVEFSAEQIIYTPV